MTDDLQTVIERCRDFAGPGWVDVENMSPECVADLLVIARAYLTVRDRIILRCRYILGVCRGEAEMRDEAEAMLTLLGAPA